jgi:hypothetical protein
MQQFLNAQLVVNDDVARHDIHRHVADGVDSERRQEPDDYRLRYEPIGRCRW